MYSLLLYTQTENKYLVPMLWAIGIALLIVFIILLFVQRRHGIRLRHELTDLDKVKQNNIEYEFVLKAMHLCTWHIDCKSRTIGVTVPLEATSLGFAGLLRQRWP